MSGGRRRGVAGRPTIPSSVITIYANVDGSNAGCLRVLIILIAVVHAIACKAQPIQTDWWYHINLENLCVST